MTTKKYHKSLFFMWPVLALKNFVVYSFTARSYFPCLYALEVGLPPSDSILQSKKNCLTSDKALNLGDASNLSYMVKLFKV